MTQAVDEKPKDHLPIAETFHSIQGEGEWVGTQMHFIRTAGCSVGKPPNIKVTRNSPFPILQTGKPAWQCHTYDGRAFWCDTDFHKREEISFATLLNNTWEDHICLTGGEPLMHPQVTEFIHLARVLGKQVHVETSGTIIPDASLLNKAWFTVAPKQNVLDEMILVWANEVKLLVTPRFFLEDIPPSIFQTKARIFLCPVNDELALDQANINICLMHLKRFPKWKLSIQMHKVIGVR